MILNKFTKVNLPNTNQTNKFKQTRQQNKTSYTRNFQIDYLVDKFQTGKRIKITIIIKIKHKTNNNLDKLLRNLNENEKYKKQNK